VLPHEPSNQNADAPADIALGFLRGILAGAGKLSRVASLQSDPAISVDELEGGAHFHPVTHISPVSRSRVLARGGKVDPMSNAALNSAVPRATVRGGL
jgi:hypothetical protein